MEVTEILNQLQIPFRLHGESEHVSANWVGIDCPYCSPNWAHFRCGINTRSGACNCWSCGRLSLVGVLRDSSGVSFGEVRSLTLGMDRSPREDHPKGKYSEPHIVTEPGFEFGTAHENYLRERGLVPSKIHRLWEVVGASQHHRLGWSLFIPVILNGERVSWTSRKINHQCESGQRYRSANAEEESVPIKDTLYGEDYCRNGVLVLEGPLDVWAVGPGAVCTYGTAYTAAQVRRIARYPRRAICFDAEPAAQRQARKLVDELSVFPGSTTCVVLETGKDPSRAKRREVAQLRRHFVE